MIASRIARSPITRNAANQARTKGFTLIEILIVVIILGILAAIVIPQFSGASTQARTSSLQTTIATLRSQIALYKLQHGDTLPDLTANSGNNWTLLTATSTYNSSTYGPYMQDIPTNPLSNGFVVANGTSSGGFQTGFDFVYDYSSGSGSGNIWGQTQNTAGGSVLP
jgi:general secretion pathway protein G